MKSPFTEGQTCDAACGGGGCDSCGEGDSFTDGAQGKVTAAVGITESAEEVARNKSEAAQDKLQGVCYGCSSFYISE